MTFVDKLAEKHGWIAIIIRAAIVEALKEAAARARGHAENVPEPCATVARDIEADILYLCGEPSVRCQCHLEAGDSPCDMHGTDEEPTK